MEDRDARLRLSRDGAHVEVRIAKKMTKVHKDRPSILDQSWGRLQTLVPTGRLALFVEHQGLGQAEFVDQPAKLLEDQLSQILAAVSLRHQRSQMHVAERAQRKREHDETTLRNLERERKDRDVQQRADEEARRRLALVSEVEDWHRAELIRAYLSVLDNRRAHGNYVTDGYGRRREWARGIAEELDRTSRRVGAPPL